MLVPILTASLTCTQLSSIATEKTINPGSVWLPRNAEQYQWSRLMEHYQLTFPDRTDMPAWIYDICIQKQKRHFKKLTIREKPSGQC